MIVRLKILISNNEWGNKTMATINEIEFFLEDYAEEIEEHFFNIPKFLSNLEKINKPLSIFSMTSLFPKIESIRLGIFEVAKINEFYSVNILYRALIEQSIKAQYLWMRIVESKDDEIGVDYWVFGKDQENIDYAKALQHSYSLIGIAPELSAIEILKKYGVILDKKSGNEIRLKQEQFKYKNMVRYINEKLKKDKSSVPSILTSIFPLYSELSSCVHGGPDSTDSYQNGAEKLQNIVTISTFISLYIRWLSFTLFYQYDKSFDSLCSITQKYLIKYLEME